MTLPAILQTVAPWCLLVLVLAIAIAFFRLLRGPTSADRLVALDLITVLAASVLGLLAMADDESTYLSVALVIALISFLATVALALYVEQEGRGEDWQEIGRGTDAEGGSDRG